MGKSNKVAVMVVVSLISVVIMLYNLQVCYIHIYASNNTWLFQDFQKQKQKNPKKTGINYSYFFFKSQSSITEVYSENNS